METALSSGAYQATVEAAKKQTAKEIDILKRAATGKGNFGLGEGTAEEANRLGRAWVGRNAKTASDGKTLVSVDGMRQYRPPGFKPKLGKSQANFEKRFKEQRTRGWQSNGHLDIKKSKKQRR